MRVEVRKDRFLFPKAPDPLHSRVLKALGLNGTPKVDGQPGPDPETARKCRDALGSIRKISREEAVQKIRRVTADWNDLTAKTLKLPSELFIFEQAAGLSLSADDKFGIIGVERYLAEGRPDLPLPKLPDYGIGLSERGSSYVTLVDMSRRIIVRMRVFSVHELEDSKWTVFSNAVRDAAAAATRIRKNDMVIINNDGFLMTRQL